MKIKTAEFIKGIVGTDKILEDETPQFAFVGRSNVGKSSLINSLVGNKKLAKSSSTPGRTQEINFFLINNKNYFVDLPGYGFAKISKTRREKIRKMIIWYLTYSGVKPKKVILIIDAKAGVKNFDLEMLDLLREENIDIIVVANKVDKIKKNKKSILSSEVKKEMGEDIIFVEYSAKTFLNKEKLIELIFTNKK